MKSECDAKAPETASVSDTISVRDCISMGDGPGGHSRSVDEFMQFSGCQDRTRAAQFIKVYNGVAAGTWRGVCARCFDTRVFLAPNPWCVL